MTSPQMSWDCRCEVQRTRHRLGGVRCGEPNLGLERADPDDAEGSKMVGRFVGMSLQMGDFDGIRQDLVGKGVEFTAPPEKQVWGGTLAHFRDSARYIRTLLG